MNALVLAIGMIAPIAVERPISPEAAEALRAASEAAGALESRATSGSPDVRAAMLNHVHRLQEGAGLWADAAATAGRMAAGVTGNYVRVSWARSLARAGAVDEAAAIADSLRGESRDQVLVALAADLARTNPSAARAIAAELAGRADAPAAWAEIGTARVAAGDAVGATAAFAEAIRVARLIPESSGFLEGRTISRLAAIDDIADRQARTGRLDDALATVELLKTVPSSLGSDRVGATRAWAGRRADLLREAGRLDEAGQALEAVTNPPIDAVVGLAEAYGRAGRPDRSARWLGEARRRIDAMAPEANRAWSLATLAEAEGRLGRIDAARATLDKAEAHALGRPADVFEPGHSLKRVTEARVAVGDLDGAARVVTLLGDRDRAASIGLVAGTWSDIGDRAAAETLLATIGDPELRALAAGPGPDEHDPPRGPESDVADRAIALAREGKVDEAIVAASEIRWLDTKLRALAGIASAAPPAADRVGRLMAGLAEAFDGRSSGRPSIAAALADAGRPALALDVMEPVREIPVGEWALIRIGTSQARAGDLAGARATIDRRLRTRAGRVPALGTLAAGLHQAGRREEARRWADRASEAVDSTVYAYVSGSDLGTVMYGRERRLEEVATIYADLGLPAEALALVTRCEAQDDGIEACLRQAARAAAVADPAWVAARRDDLAVSASGRAAILLGFAEGLIAGGRGDR